MSETNLHIKSITKNQLNLVNALLQLTSKNNINTKEVWLELLDVAEKFLLQEEIGQYRTLEYKPESISVHYKDSYYDTDLEEFTTDDLPTIKELKAKIEQESASYEDLANALSSLKEGLEQS